MTAAIEPVARTVDSSGLALHYLDWTGSDRNGDAAGGAEPLILLHGNRDHARSWDAAARALAADGWRVIALDLRGHGDSAWSPDGAYLLPYHVADLVALVEHLRVERAILIGHSFGGSVASRYAGLYPDRVAKLVAVDGFGPSLDQYAEWDAAGPIERTRDWIAGRRTAEGRAPRVLATLEDGIARMAQANPRLAPDQVRHLATHGLRAQGDGFAWKYDPRVSFFAPEDFATPITAYWAAVTAPTLLCYGAESWTADPAADGRAASLRDYRSVAIPDAGHWPHHDQLPAFLAAVTSFLA